MKLLDFMATEFWGNTVESYFAALLLFFFYKFVFWIFKNFLLSKLKLLAAKTKTKIDDIFVSSIKNIPGFFYTFTAFYLAFHSLILEANLRKFIDLVYIGYFLVQFISSIQSLIIYLIENLFKNGRQEEPGKTFIHGTQLLINFTIWITAILLVLSNFGVNVISLIASLGIGGIAVALAVQNILGDIFSAVSIYIDKPFVVGDFIVIGQYKGTVKKIGLKSTRIQSLQGEEVIVSNKDLATSTIQNFKKMEERRVSFTVQVTYDTSTENCKKIPEIIQKIIDEFEGTRIEYIVFKDYAASGLNYEAVYYHPSGDYNEYIRRQHSINIRIKEEFEKAKIEFAFPTQTLYIKNPELNEA